MPDIEIITYGGGDLLRMVFNAISMLFYGSNHNSSIVHPLCVISAMIGSIWAISRCFFHSYTDGFLTKYFLPLLVLPALLIVPQARIHIIDKLKDKPLVVDHVPLLFAKIAGLSNFWGFKITQAIENVMHTPDDVRYSHTGMIFGADMALDFSRLKLNNATMAQNICHFTQQCIIYDIALGRYTIDELRKSANLLSFLKLNTSKVRMIPYVDPQTRKMEFLSCTDSIDRMDPLFEEEARYYTNHEVLKHLPLAYQTLFSFQKSSEKQLTDQLANAHYGNPEALSKEIVAVNAFDEAAARFAVERTKANQRSIYQTGGALAGSSLVTLRIIFEALIYASCALILPLSLLPGGIKFLGGWIFLNIWIQLWPPLYAILNYITMLSAQKYTESILGGISEGFSLFTSAGFQDLAFDIAALGGYLSLSVPALSFYLLQNLQSIVRLAGPMLNPTHSSVSTAATELSTGNYSFSNTNLEQSSFGNQTAFQQNLAPSLSSGFFTDNQGVHQIKYGREQLTVNQDLSNLNTSISTAAAFTNSLQHAQQHAQTQVDSNQALYTETLGIAQRNAMDLIQHISNSEAYSGGYNTSQIAAVQESANWIRNAAESWGCQQGLSTRDSLEYFLSLGLNVPFVGKGGHGMNSNIVNDEARQSAENIVNSRDFQENYQHVMNSIQNEAYNSLSDEGKRFAENFMASSEQLKSAQEQYSSSLSDLNQISENLSFVQSNTSTVSTNLNTEFSNWLHERGQLETLLDRSRGNELDTLRDAFITEKCHAAIGNLKTFTIPGSSHYQLPNIESEGAKWKGGILQQAENNNLFYGQTLNQGESVLAQFEAHAGKTSQQISSQQQAINNAHQKQKEAFTETGKQSNYERLNTRVQENIENLPLWSWFDDYANPK